MRTARVAWAGAVHEAVPHPHGLQLCNGQVLVLQDLLGLTEKPPRFAKDFMEGAWNIGAAIRNYVASVKAGEFPGPEHGF